MLYNPYLPPFPAAFCTVYRSAVSVLSCFFHKKRPRQEVQ
nr:MAG TPA: hypothetical protein [Caudoviricetes sp.]